MVGFGEYIAARRKVLNPPCNKIVTTRASIEAKIALIAFVCRQNLLDKLSAETREC